MRRKDLESTILFDKWNKKWGRAIVKEGDKSFINQVIKKLRGKYVVSINKYKPINYKEFYNKFINKGLLKGKDNIIRELRNRYKSRLEYQTEEGQYVSSNDVKMLSN